MPGSCGASPPAPYWIHDRGRSTDPQAGTGLQELVRELQPRCDVGMVLNLSCSPFPTEEDGGSRWGPAPQHSDNGAHAALAEPNQTIRWTERGRDGASASIHEIAWFAVRISAGERARRGTVASEEFTHT